MPVGNDSARKLGDPRQIKGRLSPARNLTACFFLPPSRYFINLPNPRDRGESASSRVLDTLAGDTKARWKNGCGGRGLVPLSPRDTINPSEVDGGTMLIPRKKIRKGKKGRGEEERGKEVHSFFPWPLMRAKTLNRS